MTFHRRVAAAVALLLGFGVLPLSVASVDFWCESTFVPAAHAQSFIQNMLTRLRGEKLPPGIVKSNGRIEATQVDVSSKYAGRLVDVSVEEGSDVTQGQVVAKISSPEYEAQLRGAQADLQRAKDALVAAEADISVRQSALGFRHIRVATCTDTHKDWNHLAAGARTAATKLPSSRSVV